MADRPLSSPLGVFEAKVIPNPPEWEYACDVCADHASEPAVVGVSLANDLQIWLCREHADGLPGVPALG